MFIILPLSYKDPDVQLPNEKLCPAFDAKLNWPGTVWLLNWYPKREGEIYNDTVLNKS